MSNAAARARLVQLSEQLRALPRALALVTAPKAAEELRKQLEANITAGRGPNFEAWKRRQDGGKALQNAARDLEVTARGTVVLARLTGPSALHHLGRARGRIVRQIIPTKFVPQPVVIAVRRAMGPDFKRLLGLE